MLSGNDIHAMVFHFYLFSINLPILQKQRKLQYIDRRELSLRTAVVGGPGRWNYYIRTVTD